MALDFEKAAEFLLEQQAKTDAKLAETGVRLDKLVRVVEHVVDRQNKLDDALTDLIEAQIKTHEEIREQARRTAEQFRETDAKILAVNERVDKFVGAVGEIARRIPPAA